MKSFKAIACTMGLLVMSIPAQAAFDFGAAGDYNVLVFGDYSATGSDTQGRLAVGNDLSISGYGIINPDSKFYGSIGHDDVGPALVVGGNATLNSVQVYKGDAVISGNATINGGTFFRDLSVNGNATLNAGSVASTLTLGGSNNSIAAGFTAGQTGNGTTALPIDFAAAKNYLTDYSTNTLTSMTSTGSVKNQYGLLTLTGGDIVGDTQVFNLTGNDLTNIYDIAVANLGGATSVLINVDATTVNLSNMGASTANSLLNNHFGEFDVLFNFYNAEKLNMSGIGLFGNFLALSADVTGAGGVLTGRMIADSFNSAGGFQFNANDIPPITPVPEPSEYAMIGLGLAMIAFCVHRRRSLQS